MASPFLSNSTISFSSSLKSSTLPRLSPSVSFSSIRFKSTPRRILTVRSKIREIFMPALSSTMTEGKIVSWVKSEGDVLSKGESVVVVESDKADMDVETFYDGILAAIVVGEGETAPVGAAIGILAETEDEIAEAKAKAASKSGASAPSAPPPPAPAADSTPAPPKSTPANAAPIVTEGPRKTVATPYAKKLAKQHKVDIESLVGTGPYGRITPEDIEAAAGFFPSKTNVGPVVVVEAKPAAPTKATSDSSAPSSIPPPVPGSTVVPFTTMQAAVSKNMVESISVPTFRVGYPVTTDALDALYEKVKPKGVTMTALLAKAAAMALVQHPVVNSSCKDGKSFSYNSNINIAIAVAINGGLITPVLQDADKARTFTLSNLGMFGVDRFDAILPPGQGAIMAVGASKPTVVADADGFFSVKNKMLEAPVSIIVEKVNVTADHRIIYGADLAAFLQTFSKIVENPESLTL
ncbi:hypothetical protein V6N12_005451 [Hibiscus sabdariffa]|uniref:Dihydrolipoamide acetyltransferase component of pyruvate dehydrogenase complex n=1 Tax=Hibiscus sabdariffa TaxID=183260 RepID=A0ABR2A2Q1_9ROSI